MSKLRRYHKSEPLKVGRSCPQCGQDLVLKFNSQFPKSFVGCSGYPDCKYIEKQSMTKIESACWALDKHWVPSMTNGAYWVLEKNCESQDEIKYLLGAAHWLDFGMSNRKKALKIGIDRTHILHDGKGYEAICFNDLFWVWERWLPATVAFVPQLEFGDKFHHDFGIFSSSKKSPISTEWRFELAVEVDVHPSHVFNPEVDRYRDSLVKYRVLRLTPKNDKLLTWFEKVRNIFEANEE